MIQAVYTNLISTCSGSLKSDNLFGDPSVSSFSVSLPPFLCPSEIFAGHGAGGGNHTEARVVLQGQNPEMLFSIPTAH